MTDPHAKAVEAAVDAVEDTGLLADERGDTSSWQCQAVSETAITAYLAAMRAEGWVMVRDVGCYSHTRHYSKSRLIREAYANGHNACRAAMLKGATDGQG